MFILVHCVFILVHLHFGLIFLCCGGGAGGSGYSGGDGIAGIKQLAQHFGGFAWNRWYLFFSREWGVNIPEIIFLRLGGCKKNEKCEQ